MSGHEEFVAAGILEEGEGEDLLLEMKRSNSPMRRESLLLSSFQTI